MKLLLLACFVAAAHAASQYLRCDCNNEQAYGRDGRQLTVAGLTGYEQDTVICQEVCVAAIEEAARLFASNSLLKRKKRQVQSLPYNIPTGPSALPQSGGSAGIDGVAVPPGISVEAGPYNPYGHNPPPRHGPYHPGTIPGRGVPIGYFPSCNYDCVERCPPGAPCYFACQRHWTGRRQAPSRAARPIAPVLAARPVAVAPARRLPVRPLAARPLPLRRVAPAVPIRPLAARPLPLLRRAPLPVVPLAPRPAPLPLAAAPIAPLAAGAGPILPGPPIARSGPIFGHRNGVPTVTHIEYHRRPIAVLGRAPPPALVQPAGPALIRPIKK